MPQQNELAFVPRKAWMALIAGIFATTCLPALIGAESDPQADASGWSFVITPEQPSSINLPASKRRTPASKDTAVATNAPQDGAPKTNATQQ